MANAAQAENILDSFTECAVCLNDVTNHRALPCQHLFCQDCLEPMVTDDRISCPVCRDVCFMRGRTVDSLPRNLLLMNLLDKLCEVCKQKNRDIHCSHCSKWTCRSCLQICHREIKDTLKSLCDRTNDMTKKGQQRIQSLFDDIYRVNSHIAEISDNIDKNVDLAIEHIRTRQRAMKQELQGSKQDTLNILQSEHKSIVEDMAKLTDLSYQYTKTSTCIENLDAMSTLCEQWKPYLSAARTDSGPSCPDVLDQIPTMKTHSGEFDMKEFDLEELSVWFDSSTSGKTSNTRIHSKVDAKGGDVPGHVGPEAEQSVASYVSPETTNNLRSSAVNGTASITHDKDEDRRTGEMNFTFPSFVAVSPITGNIFITSARNHQVRVLDGEGHLLRKFATHGGNIQFSFGWDTYDGGVSVTPEGFVVVADTENDQVQIFDEDSTLLNVFGSRGTEKGQLLSPIGITVDNKGEIYVCDFGNRRIQVFGPNGNVLRVFGMKSKMGDWWPYGVAVCNDGTVIVADRGQNCNGKIEMFSRKGQHMRSICKVGNEQLLAPVGVTVDNDDNIFITDSLSNKVYVMRQNGDLVKTFGNSGPASGQFDRPCGVACTREGRIVFVDTGNNRLQFL